MMKDKQEEGKQQSTKTTARNSRASKHTHTHTHTHTSKNWGTSERLLVVAGRDPKSYRCIAHPDKKTEGNFPIIL